MQASGPRLRFFYCMGGDGEGNCASRQRDMAWSEDAGRERTKAWMQASDEGNGLGLRPIDAAAVERRRIPEIEPHGMLRQSEFSAVPTSSVDDDPLGLLCGEIAVQIGQHDGGAAWANTARRRQAHAFGVPLTSATCPLKL